MSASAFLRDESIRDHPARPITYAVVGAKMKILAMVRDGMFLLAFAVSMLLLTVAGGAGLHMLLG